MLDTVVYGAVTIYDLLLALEVVLVTVLVLKIVGLNLRRHLKTKVSESNLENVLKAITYVVSVIALIAVLPMLGINLTGFLVAGGILAIVIGFASQSIVSNLISGVFLMVERPIKIGDTVQVMDTLGFVEDIRILSTTVRTYDGVLVRIPNDKVFTSSLTNYVAHTVRRFEYVVGIPYKDDADRAVAIAKEVIEAHPFALKNPAPQLFVDALADNSVNLKVRVWSPASEWWDVRITLLWKIKCALEDADIHVPFPQREIWFNQPLETTTSAAQTTK